jgi:hypothetical protein
LVLLGWAQVHWQDAGGGCWPRGPVEIVQRVGRRGRLGSGWNWLSTQTSI